MQLHDDPHAVGRELKVLTESRPPHLAAHWSPHSAGNLTVAGVTGRIAEEGIDSRNRNSRTPAGEPSGHRGLPSQPGRPDRQRRTREPNQEASCKWRSTSHTAATVAAPTTARTRATRTSHTAEEEQQQQQQQQQKKNNDKNNRKKKNKNNHDNDAR